MKQIEPFMDDFKVDTSEFRYFYHGSSLPSFEDEFPVLLPIGGTHYFEVDGVGKLFEAYEYSYVVGDDDNYIIAVICREVENTIDMKSIIRDLKIKEILR
jgi:hypothetical protein